MKKAQMTALLFTSLTRILVIAIDFLKKLAINGSEYHAFPSPSGEKVENAAAGVARASQAKGVYSCRSLTSRDSTLSEQDKTPY
jgi:hypothetical protein